MSGIHAQRYLVHDYTETTGLPSSNVFAVTQDDSGCMWFATRTGVARYDGWEWQNHEPVKGMPSAADDHFRWDDRAHLWTVSSKFEGRIHHFDGRGWVTIDGPEALARGTRITALGAGTNGFDDVVALGTSDGSVYLRQEGSWTRLPVGPDPILSLGFADGNLFAGTAGGLAVASLDAAEPTVRQVPSVQRGVLAMSPDDEPGRLWLAGLDWIGWLQGESFTLLHDRLAFDQLPEGRFFLEPDNRGGVYVGHWAGVYHLDAGGKLEPLGPGNGLLGAGVADIHVDREDNVWFVNTRGASKLVSYRFASYQREHGLLQDEVSAVIQRASGEIALAHPFGLTLLGERTRTFEIPHDGRRTRILDLAEDSEGRLWAAIEGWGIAQISEIDGEFRLRWRDDLPGSGHSVTIDARGGLWAATEHGLYRSVSGRFEPVPVPAAAHIRRLFNGSDDALYVATASAGLLRLRAGRWTRWETPGVREANNVFAVLEDDEILVGTAEGLYRVAGDRLVEAVPRVERPVYFLVRDTTNRLWIGTDNGVLRWDGESLEPFTVHDGVVGRETNRAGGMVDSDGRLWIGTEQGVSVYRADQDRPVVVAPIVELLDAEASGRHYPLLDAVTLSHRDGDVRFRFRAVSFLDEHRIRVRARLEGFDLDWLTLGDSPPRELRYTNLPPGEYRFQVQAANARGPWSEVVSSRSITVLAPFWKQGWFAMVALLALGAAALIVQQNLGQRKYARRLEKEVRRKLAEQMEIEEELARAKRLEALGVLAGGIAHDFNNLMTTMLGNLSLIKFDPSVQSESRGNLANTEAAILRARDLTTQLLTFSRGGAPVRETAPIGETIHKSVSFAASGSNVRYAVELPEDLWFVDIDAGQMSQVIGNLLINSIEAMPEGGSVTVTGRNIEMSATPPFRKRSIEIVIRDDGHGIAPQHLARIFDPYFSTKRRGSGLGLATAYSIVGRHDGRLLADSELGRGTTFRIFLPASDSQPTRKVEAATPVAGNGARILVMDDEPAVREVIGAVLQEQGYDIEYAENGIQAIDRYEHARNEHRPFDVVILDLTIRGGMGGRETIRQLKGLDPGVKAIVVSGYSSDPVMAQYREHGFCGCVQKPFRTEELTRVVAGVAAEAPSRTRAR